MRFIRIFPAVFLLTTIIGCSSSTPIMARDAVTEADAIAVLVTEWSNLYGARDLDGITALMAQNSVLIMPGSAPISGVESIRQATQAMLESDGETSWKSDFAFVAPSGDMAYDYGTATTKLADGSTAKGYYLVVWVKENGEWKIAADMFN